MGVPNAALKHQLVKYINNALSQAGLSPTYTDRKLSDAVSNRMYTARRKSRKQALLTEGPIPVAHIASDTAVATCATQRVHINPYQFCNRHCAGLHDQQTESTCTTSMTLDDGDNAPHYDVLPGDEFFAELDTGIDQLPTPPSSPPASPSSTRDVLNCCGGAFDPTWSMAPMYNQQSTCAVSKQGSCMDVVPPFEVDTSATDCNVGISTSWDRVKEDLECVPSFYMEDCDAGQCAGAA